MRKIHHRPHHSSGLEEPTGGEVKFEGTSLTRLKSEEMRRMRRELQMVFQDPFASLNPRKTAGEIIEEPLRVHGIGTARERKEEVQRVPAGGGSRFLYAPLVIPTSLAADSDNGSGLPGRWR